MTFANFYSPRSIAEPSEAALELVCPADSLVTLRTAVDNGADWIHLDYRERKDKGSPAGLNLDNASINKGIRYAHDKRCKVLLALDAQAQLPTWSKWRDVIDQAAQCGVDAIALSDPALLLYAAAQFPELRLHYTVPDTALSCETIDFFHNQFGVSRVVLPRILTLAQIAQIARNTAVELQVVGFGRFCTIVGRSEAASAGADHPSGGVLACQEVSDKPVGCCSSGEDAANDSCFTFDLQPNIGALKLLPQLTAMGVRAIKVEAQDRGPAHLGQVIRVWREAVDECLENLDHYAVKPSWVAELNKAAKDQKIR